MPTSGLRPARAPNAEHGPGIAHTIRFNIITKTSGCDAIQFFNWRWPMRSGLFSMPVFFDPVFFDCNAATLRFDSMLFAIRFIAMRCVPIRFFTLQICSSLRCDSVALWAFWPNRIRFNFGLNRCDAIRFDHLVPPTTYNLPLATYCNPLRLVIVLSLPPF